MNDKQQLAAMGEHLAEQQQPMCLQKRVEQLEARVLALTVPEGWQLVPIDPDMKMLAAFVEAGGKAISGYKAMIAAAPSPDSAK